MRTTTRFHSDKTWRLPGEKLKDFVPPKLFAQNNSASGISTVNLKNILRQIKTNYANFHCGRLLFSWLFKHHPLWHIDAAEGRQPHHGCASGFNNRIELDGVCWFYAVVCVTRTVFGRAQSSIRLRMRHPSTASVF